MTHLPYGGSIFTDAAREKFAQDSFFLIGRIQSVQQLQRSPGEDVEPVTAEVLVPDIFVEGHALVSPQRCLLDER
jgi:hypothetical protein